MNNTSFGSFDHFAGTRELYKILFAVLDSAGIIGNLVVILTVSLNEKMRSGVYSLLCNLAVSDLLFAILAPFHINLLTEDYIWHFGATFCKIYFFCYRSFYNVSMLFLMVITVQRFRATRSPIAFRFTSRIGTRTLIIACWLLGGIISLPFFFVMKHLSFGAGNNRCFQQWPNDKLKRAYYICIYILLYIVPFLIMVILYGAMFVTLRKPCVGNINETQRRQLKKRKRVSLVVGIIVLMFFICWTPRQVLDFILIMDLTSRNNFELPTAYNYSFLLVVMSTVVNPILLNSMSSDFRKGFMGLFRRCSYANSEAISPNNAGSVIPTCANQDVELRSSRAQINRIVIETTSY